MRGRWVRLTGSLGALAAAAVSPADRFISVVAEALAPAMHHVYALLWRADCSKLLTSRDRGVASILGERHARCSHCATAELVQRPSTGQNHQGR